MAVPKKNDFALFFTLFFVNVIVCVVYGQAVAFLPAGYIMVQNCFFQGECVCYQYSDSSYKLSHTSSSSLYYSE